MANKLPSLYLGNPVLFPRGRLSKQDKSLKLPDPAEENLHPDDTEDGTLDIKALAQSYADRIIRAAGSKERAAQYLKALADGMAKAGAAQESGGRTTNVPEDQAKREDESPRFPRGVGDAETPDLPERGSDWHGTVQGVPDVPQNAKVDIGKTPEEEAEGFGKIKDQKPPSKNEEAMKALAGAPRFSPGPFVPPPEADFLTQYGYSPEEIKNGDYRIAPWMRAEYNKQRTGAIHKSIDGLLERARK